MNEKETSYTAANSIPMKLFKDSRLVETINKYGVIPPRHVQVCPTNTCNLNCPFCSCDEVDKKQKWSEDDMYNIMDILKDNGTHALTITGGGEPTLYKHINDLVYTAKDADFDLGLVSNGIPVKNLERMAVDDLTWARISFSDFRNYDDKFIDSMDYLRDSKDLDLAFSYVVTDDMNEDNIKNIMNYANDNNFTHVRFVDDIFNPDEKRMGKVKEILSEANINDDVAIYQPRSEYTEGQKECYISLLKPLIAPDGYIYPCCGVQYALPSNQKKFPKEMRMGHYSELEDIIANTKEFNGKKCTKCYYQNYNTFLKAMVGKYDHERFV